MKLPPFIQGKREFILISFMAITSIVAVSCLIYLLLWSLVPLATAIQECGGIAKCLGGFIGEVQQAAAVAKEVK